MTLKPEPLSVKFYNIKAYHTLIRNLIRCLLILLLSAYFTTASFGQVNYYATDSVMSSGVNLVDGGSLINSKFCRVKYGDKILTFSPYEVKEFGFKDGRVYISKEIQVEDSSRMVFLERLHLGQTSLYYHRERNIKTFYIEQDSTLFFELPKKNQEKESYSELLSSITGDCPIVSDVSSFVGYNKQSLSKFISRYNECELKPFPHLRYGLLAGYEFSRLIPSESMNKAGNEIIINFGYEGGFSIGLFVDQPILVSDFSLHAELEYSSHGYSYHKLIQNTDWDFIGNLSSLKVPVLLRYAYPSNRIRPFINLGPAGTYLIKNETNLFTTNIINNTIEINDAGNSQISDFLIGYGAGSGVEFKLTRRNSLFLEMRYCHQYKIGDSDFNGISGLKLLTGVNF